MKHVVMTSGGLGSWMSGKRVAAKHGTENLTLLFADVKGNNPSEHAGEDPDTYRFLVEGAANIYGLDIDLGEPTPAEVDQAAAEVDAAIARGEKGCDEPDTVTIHARYLHLRDTVAPQIPGLVWLVEGRDIFGVFKDDRFLGNSRLANCSKFLKQRPCRQWLDANADPADTTVCVGLDWSEPHRIPANKLGYAHPFNRPCVDVKACLAYVNGVEGAEPCKRHLRDKAWRVEFPMSEAPYLDKEQMAKVLDAEGIRNQWLYEVGMNHANCGGGCVRAGQAQFELLRRVHPRRFAYWMAKEQELRDFLDKDVTILKATAQPDVMHALGLREQDIAYPPRPYVCEHGVHPQECVDPTCDGYVRPAPPTVHKTGQPLPSSVPLSLAKFDDRLSAQPELFDPLDFGACGCGTPDLPEEDQ